MVIKMNVPKLRFEGFYNQWDEHTINDAFNIITDFVAAGSFASLRENVKYYNDKNFAQLIRTIDIKNNFKNKDFVYVDEKAYKFLWRVVLNEDSIILPNIGSNIGEKYYIEHNKLPYQNNVLGPNSILLRSNTHNLKFLYYVIQHRNFNIQLKNLVGASGQPKFNKTDLKKIKIKIPEIEEQEKIENMLSLLDKKIELQSQKIEALKLYKICIKNIIFNDEKYTETKLKYILKKWTEKNKNNEYDYVESVSNKHGFISQNEQFEDRNVASKDKSNYYVIRKNVFAYNPSRLDVGSLALKDNDLVSLVSPLYECFTTNQNVYFMLEWFDSKEFKKGTFSKFEGGVRNTLSFTNLCEINISLPSITEQDKIANILMSFNNKLIYENEKLKQLKNLKKGLIQNMFV